MYVIDISKVIEIFCEVDDFCKLHDEYLRAKVLSEGLKPVNNVGRPSQLSSSEILTIMIFYQLSGMKNFQYYYQRLVIPCLRCYFPGLVSYNRFVELIGEHTPLMWMFTQFQTLKSERTGRYFIDSKRLPVCHNRRIKQNKVFNGIAQRGKSSTGWFYGLKIHLVINDLGQIVRFLLTPGSTADNQEKVLHSLLDDLKGACYGDKGYISKLFDHFYQNGLKLVTKVRKNMKKLLYSFSDAIFLRKRGVIESVNDILMTVCDIEHSRHRSPNNAFAHIFASLAAYQFLNSKPAVDSQYFIAN